ncbi:uncharacterized protein [Oryza sativa Japonica Group]|uniref:uncharacterized protein isoform X2 n=1 Tax=Oryza sativa subsp. japonica TaxID=39947 RepID=UPI00339C12AF
MELSLITFTATGAAAAFTSPKIKRRMRMAPTMASKPGAKVKVLLKISLCRLQDVQRKGSCRMPRLQGHWKEQEEWQHIREMEVLRLPRVWAQELS